MVSRLKLPILVVVLLHTLNSGLCSRVLEADVGRAYVREDRELLYIGNNHIEISFRKDNGAIWFLVHKESGIDLRNEKAGSWQLTWWVMMLTSTKERILTGSSSASRFHYSFRTLSNGTEITLTWGGLRFSDGRDCPIEVSAKVSVFHDYPFSTWRATIRNFGQMAIEYMQFPLITGIQHLGADPQDDCLVLPDREGRLLHAPSANLSYCSGSYPSCSLNMQFMAYYDASCGFYFATDDTQGNVKTFSWDRPKSWASLAIWHYPNIRFSNDYDLPYNVIVGVFKGDWFKAAEIYKQWAYRQWWAKHTLTAKRTPNWTRDLAISSLFIAFAPWQAQGKTLSDIVTLVKSHQSYFGAPILVELWGWENKGAWSWGDYFPPYEGWANFDRMDKDLHNLRCRLKVFVGMISVNTATDLWKSQEPLNYTIRDKEGKTIRPKWKTTVDQAFMCIGTSYWQSKLEETVLELVRHDVDVIQFDCIPSAPATFACYDSRHGHPIGIGHWHTLAWLQTIERIISKAREINPNVAFTAEGICEIYIPFLDVAKYYRDVYEEVGNFGLGDKRLQTGEAEIIPLFNYVYHEHILCMDEYLLGFDSNVEYNILCISRMLVWGAIPLIWAPVDPKTAIQPPRRSSFEMTLRAVVARGTYAKEFLVYGQMLPVRTFNIPYVAVPFRQGPPYEVSFDMKTPAILCSAWKSSDNSVGCVLANICDKEVACQLDLGLDIRDPSRGGCTLYRVVDGDLFIISIRSKAPSNLTVTLSPRQVVLLVIADAGVPRAKAVESINNASKAIETAKNQGKTAGLAEAEQALRSATTMFLEGNFNESRKTADNIKDLLEAAGKRVETTTTSIERIEGVTLFVMVTAAVTIPLIAAVIYVRRKQKTSSVKAPRKV